MAALHIDRQTPVSAAYLNQHPYFIGGDLGAIIRCARIRYTGSAWEVVSGFFASGIVTGNLTWNSPGTNAINVAVSGFTSTPLVVLGCVGTSSYIPFFASGSSSSTNIAIAFRDFAGTQITTQDANMQAIVWIIGI